MTAAANDNEIQIKSSTWLERMKACSSRAAQPTTEGELAEFVREEAALVAEGQAINEALRRETIQLVEEVAALKRQLVADGFPIVRRVVKDTNGDDVIF